MNSPSCSGDTCGCCPSNPVEPIGMVSGLDTTPSVLGTLAAVGESLAAAIAMPPAVITALAMPPALTAAFTEWDRTTETVAVAVRRHMAWRKAHPFAYMRARWELRAARHLDRFRAALVALRPAPRPLRHAAMLHLAAVATARVNRWRALESRIASLVALVATRPVHGPPAPSL